MTDKRLVRVVVRTWSAMWSAINVRFSNWKTALVRIGPRCFLKGACTEKVRYRDGAY